MIDDKQIPNWLTKKLKFEDLQSIKEAVTQAELKTSGEIVPIIVRRSSVLGHVPVIILLFLLMVSILSYLQFEVPFVFLILSVVASVVLTVFLSRIELLQRVLTSRTDQDTQVRNRALYEFYSQKVHKTQNKTGILIFISLLEHEVVVWGDQAINNKLTPDVWNDVVKTITQGIKANKLSFGLVEGITKCGAILSQHFPKTHDDENELKNSLIIKE